jgi:hypothetical protein
VDDRRGARLEVLCHEGLSENEIRRYRQIRQLPVGIHLSIIIRYLYHPAGIQLEIDFMGFIELYYGSLGHS